MPRFDDRKLRKGNDGGDFQEFVWEALKTGHFEKLLGGRYVQPYFVAGNDGGIDHLAVGEGDQIVIECKFHGEERKDRPESDWVKVATALLTNLRESAEAGPGNIARLCLPWFDRERPIKGYWFCTSGATTPGAQTNLRQCIQGVFARLADENPLLAHLGDIDVEVLGWNDFSGALQANPTLDFRWFGTLPVGLRPLRSITEGKTFRRFLDEGRLPFFSREVFNREALSGSQPRPTQQIGTRLAPGFRG